MAAAPDRCRLAYGVKAREGSSRPNLIVRRGGTATLGVSRDALSTMGEAGARLLLDAAEAWRTHEVVRVMRADASFVDAYIYSSTSLASPEFGALLALLARYAWHTCDRVRGASDATIYDFLRLTPEECDVAMRLPSAPLRDCAVCAWLFTRHGDWL